MNPHHVYVMNKTLNESIRQVRGITAFLDSVAMKVFLLDHT